MQNLIDQILDDIAKECGYRCVRMFKYQSELVKSARNLGDLIITLDDAYIFVLGFNTSYSVTVFVSGCDIILDVDGRVAFDIRDPLSIDKMIEYFNARRFLALRDCRHDL